MSVTYIPAQLRRAVLHRADWLCEYCLIHEDDTFLGCQVDHIIAEKHGGITDFTNLALACTNCNRAKGSDIATLIDETLFVCSIRVLITGQNILSWHMTE